jgi:hypothetical protein
MYLIYGAMMNYAQGDGGFATTATLLSMCILVVVGMTVGLYGWGRWF